jgi:hypothetical protein
MPPQRPRLSYGRWASGRILSAQQGILTSEIWYHRSCFQTGCRLANVLRILVEIRDAGRDSQRAQQGLADER